MTVSGKLLRRLTWSGWVAMGRGGGLLKKRVFFLFHVILMRTTFWSGAEERLKIEWFKNRRLLASHAW